MEHRYLCRLAAGLAPILFVLAAGLPAAAPAGAADAPATRGQAEPRAAQLAEVELKVAAVAQQEQAVEARVVGAELAAQRLAASLRVLRTRFDAVMADAYVDAGGGPADAPQPYLEAVGRVTQRVVGRYLRARASVDRQWGTARADLRLLDQRRADLVGEQRRLAALVQADQARRQQLASADAAALALGNATRLAAHAQAAAPISLSATRAQLQLMSRLPFGPVAVGPGGPVLPAGLSPTGTVVAGTASWYGPGFDGQPTATGAVYDEAAWTVASPDLPLGTVLLVSGAQKAVLLLVNDRGPYVPGRVLDLSHAAAMALGSTGLLDVHAEVLAPTPAT